MLPVFEDANALLYYGQQYEGLEDSPNIFYTGATTNQQIIPALDYLKEQGVTSLYLVGSDYVFPRTSNAIVKAYAQANGIEIKGEDYTPRWAAPTSRRSSTRSAARAPTRCSTWWWVTRWSRSSASTRTPA